MHKMFIQLIVPSHNYIVDVLYSLPEMVGHLACDPAIVKLMYVEMDSNLI